MLVDPAKITIKRSMIYRHVRERMAAYFKMCLEHSKMEDGLRPTLTGLAFHMGFNSLVHMKRVANEPDFKGLINKGMTLVENYYESTGTIFAMFALKQLGWSDQVEINQVTNQVTKVILSVEGETPKQIMEGKIIELNPEKVEQGSNKTRG